MPSHGNNNRKSEWRPPTTAYCCAIELVWGYDPNFIFSKHLEVQFLHSHVCAIFFAHAVIQHSPWFSSMSISSCWIPSYIADILPWSSFLCLCVSICVSVYLSVYKNTHPDSRQCPSRAAGSHLVTPTFCRWVLSFVFPWPRFLGCPPSLALTVALVPPICWRMTWKWIQRD